VSRYKPTDVTQDFRRVPTGNRKPHNGVCEHMVTSGALYPAYVRGEPYLGAHQVAEAATEFQKILNHRGIVFADPWARWRVCNSAERSL
jgi:hypothetical protein